MDLASIPSMLVGVGIVAFYVLIIGFVLTLLARLVRAVERIADNLDKPDRH